MLMLQVKCRDVLAQGSVYIDGAQTLRQRMALGVHLLICGHCRRYLRSLRLTRGSVQSLPLPVGDETVTSVLKHIPDPD